VQCGHSQTYTWGIFDFYDEIDNIGATRRMNTFPAWVITQLLGSGKFDAEAVRAVEQLVP
jgi:hypothetical protein